MIALGLARYGLKKEVATLLGGMFDAAIYDDLRRLPAALSNVLQTVAASPDPEIAIKNQGGLAELTGNNFTISPGVAGIEVNGFGERTGNADLIPIVANLRLKMGADCLSEAAMADHAHHGAGHSHGAGGGIEWEDDMVDVNRLTTPANMHWNLIDRQTGAVNHASDHRRRRHQHN